MAKITGIGGVFIKQPYDATKLIKWYQETLEIDVTEYGLNFLNGNSASLVTFEQSDKPSVVLNFTVDNLDEFMEKLKSRKVEVISDIKQYNYGKFSQIKDPNGTVVELWEPYINEYKNMVNKEIKEFHKEDK